jgi:hypothetical protein
MEYLEHDNGSVASARVCVCVRACVRACACVRVRALGYAQPPTHQQSTHSVTHPSVNTQWTKRATHSQQTPTMPMPIIMHAAEAPHNLNGDMLCTVLPYLGHGSEHSATSPAARKTQPKKDIEVLVLHSVSSTFAPKQESGHAHSSERHVWSLPESLCMVGFIALALVTL